MGITSFNPSYELALEQRDAFKPVKPFQLDVQQHHIDMARRAAYRLIQRARLEYLRAGHVGVEYHAQSGAASKFIWSFWTI